MAIVIQNEEREQGGSLGIIVWFVIVVVIGAAAYYIFFKKAELVDVITPSHLTAAEGLSRARIDPGVVLQSPKFQALKSQVPPIIAPEGGKANPFQ